ncbi:hypothetical protein I4U23_030557 [Adineta vaga]|nr:hypothetical protein I4U23_030557 [Adineta vaga]
MLWLESLPDDWWITYQSKISFSSECIQELNIELLFIVRNLIIETRTYARACLRTCLRTNDFQNVLENRNICQSFQNLSNTFPTEENNIISISSLIEPIEQLSRKMNRLELTIHWLAIDGEQPITSENPLPNFSEDHPIERNQLEPIRDRKMLPTELINQSPSIQRLFQLANSTQINRHQLQEHIHPLTKNNLTVKPIHPVNIPIRRSTIHNHIPKVPSFQGSLAHELSLEQQFYFKTLTESCFNDIDGQQSNAFHCLSTDAALQPLLPRLLLFITKGIETNIHQHDLNFLHQFLNILTKLISNSFLSFDKYLHTILPSLLTCLICIFDIPKLDNTFPINDSDNYSIIWRIREQASDLIYHVAHKYSMISHLTDRIISIVKSTLIDHNEKLTFSIVYACIRTLLFIDIQHYHSFALNILQTNQKQNIFESDFDLDHTEQQTLFKQKINELFPIDNFVTY